MKTLLLDGDIFAYKAAASHQRTVEWEPGVHSVWFEEDAGKAWADRKIAEVQETLKGDAIIVALSDTANFRKAILPTYKSNRPADKKPVGLGIMKDYLREAYKVFERPTLEGDDVLGILATSSKIVPGEKIIVSLDKDMKTIPGKLYNDGKPELGVVEITEEDADYWHLMQTLMGDQTDGYTGCPGIGPKKAEAILFGAAPPYGTGPEAWAAVVKAYEKAKLSEEEALVQARVARILRNTDYDFKRKEPILWKP